MIGSALQNTHMIEARPTVELLSPPEELALIRNQRKSDRVHRSSVSRARKDPAHPAYRRPDGTFLDDRTTATVEGLAVVIRAPKDAIEKFWADRRRGPARRAAAAEPTSPDTTERP